MSEKWLTANDIAERVGIRAHDFRTRVSRGYAPKPDDPGDRLLLCDGTTVRLPATRATPHWLAEGPIRAWIDDVKASKAAR